MYLAKSCPFEETIEEHTDNLIDNLEVLKDIYSEKININWDLLELACLYHDIGKVNRVFQKKIKGEKISSSLPNIPHGYLSVMLLNYKKLIREYNLTKNEIVTLINVVAHHHKRKPFNEDMISDIKDFKQYFKEDIKDFNYYRLPYVEEDFNEASLHAVNKSGISGFSLDQIKDYILLKGLLNKLDFAASGHYKIEYPNDFLEESLDNLKKRWGKDARFNNLQKYMITNRNENVIAIAETGYGKTEAGLLWIGNNKGFFTLPLKSAINQIYERIRNEIVLENISERVGLLHSDTLSEYLLRNKNQLDQDLLDYKEITDELSMPLTICTIDQIFDFVYKYVGFERKLATLSYSKVVIDEIQMYSSDLVAYIIIGLNEIYNMGGKFAIITATFPPFIKDLLEKDNIKFKMPKPFLYNDRLRHSLKIKKDIINSKFIYSKYQNNKVLVIVNTVKKLNEISSELVNIYNMKEYLNVFHSGFIKSDRMKKEEQIIHFGQKNNKETGIWICTQVAEASLDIDFDILITELSDLNGLFQRMGRCYRARQLDVDYNIYVFDGGEEKCSGIGYVNDKDIYTMSKEVLRKKGDGPISEKEKIELVNKIYSTDSLKNTRYYKEILQTIEYIKSINYDEFNKKDVIRYFRNINSIDVIPSPVYEKNKEKIDKIIIQLTNNSNFNKSDIFILKKKLKLKLEEFKVSIPYYFVDSENIEVIKIDKYSTLNIYYCDYSSEFGIKHLEKEEERRENLEMFF